MSCLPAEERHRICSSHSAPDTLREKDEGTELAVAGAASQRGLRPRWIMKLVRDISSGTRLKQLAHKRNCSWMCRILKILFSSSWHSFFLLHLASLHLAAHPNPAWSLAVSLFPLPPFCLFFSLFPDSFISWPLPFSTCKSLVTKVLRFVRSRQRGHTREGRPRGVCPRRRAPCVERLEL